MPVSNYEFILFSILSGIKTSVSIYLIDGPPLKYPTLAHELNEATPNIFYTKVPLFIKKCQQGRPSPFHPRNEEFSRLFFPQNWNDLCFHNEPI